MARKASTERKTFLEQLDEKYGDLYQKPENNDSIKQQTFIPTGSLSLDACTGRGGFPRGKVTFLYGSEGKGKSHLTLNFCKKCIKQEKLNVLYIDAELGVDEDLVVDTVGKPDSLEQGELASVLNFCAYYGDNYIRVLKVRTFEQALDIMQIAVRTKEYQVVIFDSISAISPKEELDKEIIEATMSKQARSLNVLFRTTMFDMLANQVTCVFISQVRDSFNSYVVTEIPTGGHGVKHFASLELHIQQPPQKDIESYVNSTEKVVMHDAEGNPLYKWAKVTIKKSKIGKPYRTCYFPILFGKGIDEVRDILNFAVFLGIVEKRGSWYIFGEEKLGQGIDTALETVSSNEEMRNKIMSLSLDMLSSKSSLDSEEEV
jgi:recombination protein RecA